LTFDLGVSEGLVSLLAAFYSSLLEMVVFRRSKLSFFRSNLNGDRTFFHPVLFIVTRSSIIAMSDYGGDNDEPYNSVPVEAANRGLDLTID